MKKTIKSYWDVDLSGRFTDNNSNTLCIILPGIGYYLEKSYLDYSKQLADELNLDILEIEYGFQAAKKNFSVPEEFEIALGETKDIINSYLDKNYERIIIIGKSIGTAMQSCLNKELKVNNIINIYMSPIDKTVEFGIAKNSLVITGLADPLLSSESLEKINKIEGVKLVTVEDAGHSLDIHKDVFKSIDELRNVIQIEKNFIQK